MCWHCCLKDKKCDGFYIKKIDEDYWTYLQEDNAPYAKILNESIHNNTIYHSTHMTGSSVAVYCDNEFYIPSNFSGPGPGKENIRYIELGIRTDNTIKKIEILYPFKELGGYFGFITGSTV